MWSSGLPFVICTPHASPLTPPLTAACHKLADKLLFYTARCIYKKLLPSWVHNCTPYRVCMLNQPAAQGTVKIFTLLISPQYAKSSDCWLFGGVPEGDQPGAMVIASTVEYRNTDSGRRQGPPRHRQTDGQTTIQTARQTDRQADRQTGRQADRQASRQTYIQTYRQTDKHTYIHTAPVSKVLGLASQSSVETW